MENNKEITLYAHQQEVLDWGPKFSHLLPERFGLFFAPRTGKTFILMGLLKKYNVSGLIIVPKGIKKQWEDIALPLGHLVVTKEEFRRDHKSLPKMDAFIFDEAHHCSNVKSQLTKACIWYMRNHNPRYRWLATGTPYRSSPMSIFGLGILLGANWNYWTYFNKFYAMIPMGSRNVPKLRAGMEDELERYVRGIGITLKLEDVVKTINPKVEEEILELTEEQIEGIKNLDEAVPIARFTKMHEIEQGFIKGDEYVDTIRYKSNKMDRVLKLASRHDKMAIVCRYTEQIMVLYWELTQKGRTVYIISGQSKDRAQIVKDIEASNNCIVLIQSACGEGYDVSSIDTMVFASLSFSHSDHIQIRDRIVRMDRPKENHYIYLLSGRIDELVYANIMRKMDFHMQIFAQKNIINYDDIDPLI